MVARDLGRGRVLAQHPTRDKDGNWSEPHVGTVRDTREDHKPTEETEPVSGRSTAYSDDSETRSTSKSSGKKES